MSDVPLKPQRMNDAQVLLSILDHLPTSIFVKDENLRFVYSNLLHCGLIRKPEEELLGFSDADFWPEEEAMDFLVHDQNVIHDGKVNIAEESVPGIDGKPVPLLTRKARMVGPDGKTYLIGTNTDLTALKHREEQYKVLAQTVPVAIVQIEEGGGIILSNPLFQEYCGSDDEQQGLKVLRDIAGNHADFPGKACKFESELAGDSGPSRSVLVISSGWLTHADANRQAIISIVDVSEMTELRRINDDVSRLNRELASSVKKLKEAQDELISKGRMEQLGQLTATVAHELRNPLGSVRTSTFLLERKIKGSGLDVGAQIDRINKGIMRCDGIITQLLDFSRNKPLNCQPDDLDAWLAQVLDEEARKLPAILTISCDLGLAGALVPFDPSRLQRAIVNLLSNASEAMVGQGDNPEKFTTVTPTISVSTRVSGNEVVIAVEDNGPGMTAEVLQRIREPLFTTKSFGTGLGVPAIEQIAVQHGGRLEITSESGSGACFTLRLPPSRAEDVTQAA